MVLELIRLKNHSPLWTKKRNCPVVGDVKEKNEVSLDFD
jgi:hypothetical protein